MGLEDCIITCNCEITLKTKNISCNYGYVCFFECSIICLLVDFASSINHNARSSLCLRLA
jgi:hypothetical protein